MILLTGGAGQLGTALRRRLDDVVAPPRADFDLSRPDSLVKRLTEMDPTAIINCAAYTGVDRAEDEPELAMAVNAEAVGILARFAAAAGIPLVTFSSDYVFDGTAVEPYVESSSTAPINEYGRSKERGEREALGAHPGALVVRTSWLVSDTHPNFVTTIIDRAAQGPVSVVSDQIGSPTHADDLAAATLAALDRGATGILHLTNSGRTSWFGLARFACATAGVDPDRVQPTTTEVYRPKAVRPRFSVLGSERLSDLGLPALRPWEEAITDLIEAGPTRRSGS